jgi:protein-tyrosine phosphatase
MAAADGIETIVATPHMKEGAYVNEAPGIRAAVAVMQQAVTGAGIDLRILAGSEVYWAPGLPEGVRAGRLATLGDAGRYMLLELPHRQQPVQVEETIFGLRLAGITPVLAHPERILYFQEDVRALSETMVRRRMIHFVSSDAHDLRYRPPVMSRARERIAAIAGDEEAVRLTLENPRAVIEGREIEPADPLPPGSGGSGRGLFGRLLGRVIKSGP